MLSQREEKPKRIAEKAAKFFTLGYDFDGEWSATQLRRPQLVKVYARIPIADPS